MRESSKKACALVFLLLGNSILPSMAFQRCSASQKLRSKIGEVTPIALLQHGDRCGFSQLAMSSSNNGVDDNTVPSTNSVDWGRFGLFAGVGFLYWYLMVLGAAADASGLPVPSFIPLTPGWPANDADFSPVIEDSYHFFYLSELLGNKEAPYVIPPRLAVFNGVEAWIFAMLPALWKDTNRRLPRPVLLFSWLILGINLTNAFLAPYLAITELRGTSGDNSLVNEDLKPSRAKNRIISSIFGGVAVAVAGYALIQSLVVATASDWTEFSQLVKTDRSYLAFCVDPALFAIFQPLILSRVKTETSSLDYVPFVGLVAWLFAVEETE